MGRNRPIRGFSSGGQEERFEVEWGGRRVGEVA
jgi:hypothetical protein